MNGAHRRDGLVAVTGGRVPARGTLARREIVDVAPTLLALAGVPVPRGLDGRAIDEVLEGPPSWDEAVPPPAARPLHFDPEEAAAMAARLRALGYLEPERS
jgi:arylsulfatase A-like enzyme